MGRGELEGLLLDVDRPAFHGFSGAWRGAAHRIGRGRASAVDCSRPCGGPRMSRTLRLLLAALLLLAPPAGATWSIVLVDTATGEVAIGAATCLEALDLHKLLPVLVVGRGGGAAQSAIDTTASNRKEIFAGLQAGTPPEEIIVQLLDGDLQWKARQYGIADHSPAAAGYTGGAAFGYKEHVTGTQGTLTFAIQGNILAGAAVIDAAQAAVLDTPGSLADRLMAGMEAARAMGGDGRCSCSEAAPQSCGSPPPSFEKSAHIGFVVVARIGDTDGVCNALVGCASGEYWLKLNVKGQDQADPDPVFQLQAQYADFLAGLAGRPDGLRSVAGFAHDALLADGASTRTLSLALYDHLGAPITSGGAAVSVQHAPGSAGSCAIGAVVDHGDGTYEVPVTAGLVTGLDLFNVRVDDGVKPATLYPYPALELREALRTDVASLPGSVGGTAQLDLLGPSAAAGRPFALALSAAGTVPGQVLPGGALLP
ncbi:MAG: DUF1028 domain-containing protein, partial [Planctomycetes bacterium]|nr:DUF1028 domain-containing protein [Planctomycetota bacterium]